MAFNPFRAFRKHQKVFMAGLVFVAMITFVLAGSSGIFQEVTGWFGPGGRGTPVAHLYGKPVYAQEVNQVRQQRELANFFLVNAISESGNAVCQRLQNEISKSKLSKETQGQLTQQLVMRPLYLSRQFGGGQAQTEGYIRQMYQTAQSLQFRLTPEESGDARLIQQFLDVLEQDFLLVSRSGQYYFGGSRDSKDILDFLIWQHQADRLGIQLNHDDIKALLKQEARDQFTSEVNKRVQGQMLRQYREVPPETLDRALAAEFRARLAQEAVLGVAAPYYSQVSPALTPYDFWNFYKEQRAEGLVAMLPIPVASADFLKQAGEPSADDLKALYDKGKDRLYNPASPEAGFKQPTRVLLEWVTADPDSPHYQRAADFAMAATQVTLPLAYEFALRDQYQGMRWRPGFRSPSWLNDDWEVLHESSVNRPQNVAAAVGQALGASATHGPAALSAWSTYRNSATVSEVQERRHRGLQLVPAWLTGSPWVPLALTAAATPKTEYLPLEKVRPYVVDQYKQEVARQLAAGALEEVSKDLSNRSRFKPAFASVHEELDANRAAPAIAFGHGVGPAAPLAAAAMAYQHQLVLARDRARAACAMGFGNVSPTASLALASLVYREKNLVINDLRKHVTEAIDKYALKFGKADKLRDKYDLSSDPGLAPLKAAAEKSWEFGPEDKTNSLGDKVLTRVEHGNPFDPQHVSGPDSKAAFLFWKSQEQPEYVPPFDEIKDKVVMRWKFEKARAQARQEAEEVLAKLPKSHNGPAVEEALREGSKHAGRLVTLTQVARLVPRRVAMQSQFAPSEGYEPYKIPPTLVEYSTQEMVTKILDLKEPGDAVVVHDQPEGTYYVAALVYRSQAYEMAFYKDAAQPQSQPQSLLTWFEKDTKYREKKRQALLEQLRVEARLSIDEENLKKGTSTGSRDDE